MGVVLLNPGISSNSNNSASQPFKVVVHELLLTSPDNIPNGKVSVQHLPQEGNVINLVFALDVSKYLNKFKDLIDTENFIIEIQNLTRQKTLVGKVTNIANDEVKITIEATGNKTIAFADIKQGDELLVDLDFDTKSTIKLTQQFASRQYTVSEYYRFGDSISANFGIPEGFSYNELLANLYNTKLFTFSLDSSGCKTAIISHTSQINPRHNILTSVMVGLNDLRRGGSDIKTTSKIKECYRGIIVNQFLKTFTTSSAVSITTNGTWTSENASANGGKTTTASVSTVSGNYKEYTFKDTNVAVGFICSDGAEVFGTFDVILDGVLHSQHTLNEKTDNVDPYAPYVVYVEGLEDVEHTIRIEHTDNNKIILDYFGNLENPVFATPIIIYDVPLMTAYGVSPNLGSDAIINAFNIELANLITEFDSNYPIVYVKTNDYYDINTGLSADGIHPNLVGQRQIYYGSYKELEKLDLKVDLTDVLLQNNALSGNYAIDWDYKTHNYILTANVTLTEKNTPATNKTDTITIWVTGDFNLNFPSSWNVSGAYNGAVTNVIVVEYINSGKIEAKISQ